jgi:hypothetical protein
MERYMPEIFEASAREWGFKMKSMTKTRKAMCRQLMGR